MIGKNLLKNRYTYIASIEFTGVLILALFIWNHSNSTVKPPFSGLNFTLYAPNKLPRGYGIDPNSWIKDAGIVSFKIISKNNPSLTVTEQAAIPSRELVRIKTGTLINNNFGEGYIQKLDHEGSWRATIITPSTTIFITQTGKISSDDIVEIVMRFTRSK